MMIEGQHVRLRSIESGDFTKLVEWTRDADVNQFVHADYPDDLEDCQRWFRSLKGNRHKQHFAILRENRLIGDVELDHITWRSGDAELRIRIGEKDVWNQGYGTDAVLALLNHAFLAMNLQRVYLRVYTLNIRAIRCYEKCGFRKEGRLRRTGEQLETQELLLMRILKEEFIRLMQRPRRRAV